MNLNQLRPASELAGRFGVKSLVYGGPGTGKTPIVNTAPRPVLCAVEPGLTSMRNSNVPTWEAYTADKIDEFFLWLKTPESRAFDTVAIDSVSQMAEVYLGVALKKNAHGKAAYGDMARAVMKNMNDLFYMPQKHVYLISKQGLFEEGGTNVRKPWFPGKDLNVQVPHMYDLIMHLARVTIPGIPQQQLAFRTQNDFDIVARDRSGKLDQFEYPDLSRIFAKCMS